MFIKNKILFLLLILNILLNGLWLTICLEKAIEKLTVVKEVSFSEGLEELFQENSKQTLYYRTDNAIYSFTPRKDGSFVLRKLVKNK